MGCLQDDVIAAIFGGGLSADDEARAHAHMDECSPCRERVREQAMHRTARGAASIRPPGSTPPPLLWPPPEKQAGEIIDGRYELAEPLGKGTFGEVFHARDRENRFSPDVAIKFLLAEHMLSPGLRQRFRNEALALEALGKHPNVIGLRSRGEHRGQPYMALEYRRGHSLASWLDGHRKKDGAPRLPDLAVVRDLMQQICAAVAAAHELEPPLLHRDIKPDNVLLSVDSRAEADRSVRERGRAYHASVLDFGLAKIGDSQGLGTASGQQVGTTIYMSPEQGQGEVHSQGPPADVFALGVLLLELLTLRPCSEEGRALWVTAMTEPAQLRQLSSRRREVPAAVWAVLEKALQPAPGDRQKNARALQRELLDAWPVERDDPPMAPPPRPPLSIRRGAAWLGLPLLLAGGVGAAVKLRPAREVRAPFVARSCEGVTAPGMACIPGGRLTMGSSAKEAAADLKGCQQTKGCFPRPEVYERQIPQQQVNVQSYLLDTYEVANLDYAAFLDELEHRGELSIDKDGVVRDRAHPLVEIAPSFSGLARNAERFFAVDGAERTPVIKVSWYGARRFCQHYGKDLPTEAQWELAAAGLDGRRHPWGDRRPGCAEVSVGRGVEAMYQAPCVAAVWDGMPGPANVGSSPLDRTPDGVHDLGGSVFEWVRDGFRHRYQPDAGPCRDAAGGGSPECSMRGGNFVEVLPQRSSRLRYRQAPEDMTRNKGFRCARPLG